MAQRKARTRPLVTVRPQRRLARTERAAWALGALLALGCDDAPPAAKGVPQARRAPRAAAAPSSPAAAGSHAPPPDVAAAESTLSAVVAGASPGACPKGMLRVPGARFRVGTNSPGAAPEERPAFETDVADFCIDPTEVTTDAFAECARQGKCTPAREERRFCNTGKPGRGDHPVNCVDWNQANAYCAYREARLPTEVEFEFVARGGTEYRAYAWGNEPPDGRTCWKHVGGSCPVRQFPAGAFGLFDVIGNVWEWTDDWFGDYPWPPAHGTNKVYRGGSWSRRFEKWMSPRLRNRYRPSEWGSHLGFRCAATPSDARCAYGRSADGKRCLHGVASIECPPRSTWNGVRCARPGEPECPLGYGKRPGHGCQLELDVKGPAPGRETTPVTRVRTPEFDADCAQNKPGRPISYRYAGGTHHTRNQVSAGAGCANRDVGVGWNSCCCP